MEIKRTQIASAAVDQSRLFQTRFGDRLVSRHAPVLLEPPGVSTGGGVQAQQQIILQPRVQAGPTINIGSMNLTTKTAKLRTHDCLRQVHQLRFPGHPFPIEPTEYQMFLDDARGFLQALGMQVMIESQPPSTEGTVRHSMAPPAGGSSQRALLVWAILATLLLLLLALFFVAQRFFGLRLL
ncbi:MAG: hypothetical protein JRI23_30900 [Deltaproteobacteria bacterium]|jgi:hypothetical protein|nr:hypothetical protein [Deltaproteobacteria bacterium]MBW2536610.1 hypothetical protein [Deltaproteobacteria bacterium]